MEAYLGVGVSEVLKYSNLAQRVQSEEKRGVKDKWTQINEDTALLLAVVVTVVTLC